MKKNLTILMLTLSIISLNAAELVCEGLTPRKGNNKCQYQSVFSWTASSANTMQLFAFEAGTLALYDSLYITLSDFVDLTEDQSVGSANKVRLLFLDADSKTVKTQQFATINNKQKSLHLASLMTEEQLATVTEIAFGGSCAAGSVVVNPNSVCLVKADQSSLVCEGFVKRPKNNKCSFSSVFSWSDSKANTMQLFALKAGSLSAYDTLSITMSNFQNLDSVEVGNGYKARIVFIAEDKTVKTQYFSNINGEKKIVLADIMSSDEIASVDLIAIGGACPAGSIEVEAESIRLYSAGTTALNDVLSDKAKSIKVIENGQLVIIKNDVRYNILGQIK